MKGQDIKYVALKSQAEAKVFCSYPGNVAAQYGFASGDSSCSSGCGHVTHLLKPVPALAEGGEVAKIIALHRSPSAKQAHGVP